MYCKKTIEDCRGRKTIFAIVALLLLIIRSVDASTITVIPSTEPAPVPYSLYKTAGWLDVYVPKFDSSLGTLQSVEIESNFDASVGWGWSVTQNDEFVRALLEVNYRLARPDFSNILTGMTSITHAAQGSFGWTDPLSATGLSQVLTSTSDLSLFTGSGDLTLFDRASADVVFLEGKARLQTPYPNASSFNRYLEVTYTYDETSNSTTIPEPATSVLFGFGLLAISMVSRKNIISS